MRAFAKFLLPALALAAAGIVGTVGEAKAQGSPFGVVNGQFLTCNFSGAISITYQGAVTQGTVTGSGTFQVTATANFNPLAPASRNIVSYVPTGIQASTTVPGLGPVITSLDTRQPAPTSSTSSINPGTAAFPAVSAMAYPAATTINGRIYRSQGVVNFVSNFVNTAFPFLNEPFGLAGSVTFVSDDGQDSFTLSTLNSTFNN